MIRGFGNGMFLAYSQTFNGWETFKIIFSACLIKAVI